MTKATQDQKPVMVSERTAPKTELAVIPFSQEAEEAVLGSCLLQPSIFPIVARRCVAEDFFLVRHGYIFRAMENLYKQDQTFDYLTLSEYLRDKGVLETIGDVSFLTRLVNQTPTATHAEIYAELVARHATRRRMLEASDDIRKHALDTNLPIEDVIAKSEKALSVSTLNYANRQEEFWTDIVSAEMDKHIDPDKYRNHGVTLNSPFKTARLKLQEDEVTYLAGLTGTGKTAFTLWLIKYYLEQGLTIADVSLEMSKRKILHRLTAASTGLSAEAIENRTYDPSMASAVIGAMSDLSQYEGQLHIIENARSAKAINRAVASLAYHQSIDLVVVDHLKLVDGDGRRHKEYERLEQVAQEFQAQAKEYHCPYLVLHQLKSPPPHRSDKTPYSYDLYGGKYVEHVADNIYAIHRDDHPELEIEHAQRGKIDLYELKNRNSGNNRRKLVGRVKYLGNEMYTDWQ